ncbi:LCP family protein [Candidatus Woesebacteria bacterium]|nr:LCP family protein [Candidatus Woesebacteria bacterium]
MNEPELNTTVGPTFWQLFFKATGLALLFASGMLIITALAVGAVFYHKLQVFSQTSGVPIGTLRQIVEDGWKKQPVTTQGRKNVLLLGIDSLPNRGSVPELTDTMLLASLDLNSGTIYTIPLPRDLWTPEYKTKINALYAYGKDRYPGHPEQFPTEVLQQMTGVTINHTVVISIGTLSELIDLLGGIEVVVPTSFTDIQFPRSDVNIQVERDPKKLYETVAFSQGTEVMTGERALQYIRSRHSEGDTGTDIDRGLRQQQVIDGILKKAQSKELLTNPVVLGKLYAWYAHHFATAITPEEIIATGKALYPHRETITHKSTDLTVFPKDPTGTISNPPIKKYNQWVYEVRDPAAFMAAVHTSLGMP